MTLSAWSPPPALAWRRPAAHRGHCRPAGAVRPLTGTPLRRTVVVTRTGSTYQPIAADQFRATLRPIFPTLVRPDLLFNPAADLVRCSTGPGMGKRRQSRRSGRVMLPR